MDQAELDRWFRVDGATRRGFAAGERPISPEDLRLARGAVAGAIVFVGAVCGSPIGGTYGQDTLLAAGLPGWAAAALGWIGPIAAACILALATVSLAARPIAWWAGRLDGRRVIAVVADLDETDGALALPGGQVALLPWFDVDLPPAEPAPALTPGRYRAYLAYAVNAPALLLALEHVPAGTALTPPMPARRAARRADLAGAAATGLGVAALVALGRAEPAPGAAIVWCIVGFAGVLGGLRTVWRRRWDATLAAAFAGGMLGILAWVVGRASVY